MPKIFKIKSSTNLTPVVGFAVRDQRQAEIIKGETFTYSSISAKLNNVLQHLMVEPRRSVGILRLGLEIKETQIIES